MFLPNVILIGFQEQGNLGVGYVAAMLLQRGFAVRILDFRSDLRIRYWLGFR